MNKHEYKDELLQKGCQKNTQKSKTEKAQYDLISIKIPSQEFDSFRTFALKCELG